MKYPILAALLVAASPPAGAPYAAQPWREPVPYGSNYAPAQLIDQLAAQIDRYARDGIISRAEAQRRHAELAAVRTLQSRYRRGGLSSRERSDLVQRTQAIRDRLLVAEQQRLGRPPIARRLIPREEPLFEDARRPTVVDRNHARRLDMDRRASDRRYEESRYGDPDDQDMNTLRGPPPPKRDEGS